MAEMWQRAYGSNSIISLKDREDFKLYEVRNT